MIDLGLGIDDLKVLKDAAQESIQTNVEYMSGDKVSPFSKWLIKTMFCLALEMN